MIKRGINRITRAVIINWMLFNIVSAQVISPFNKLELKDSSKKYSFIVSGHFHGASTNASTFPASSLQANIDTLNSLDASFFMSLGDMFVDVNQTYLNHYQKSLFNKLKMPLFNAVGNHDVSNGNMYEKVFGKEFFSFNCGSELYIVLNTELNDGSVKNEQLAFFKTTMNSVSSEKIKNIFVFSHRAVWAENNERYKNLFNGNTRTMLGSNNFEETIKPILLQYSKNKNVYWISGSMGGGPASFFYDKDVQSNIVFMQTAIRDQERDAALLVNVDNGLISFNGISFTGQNLNKIESYNIDFWGGNPDPSENFNYRLLPYLTMQMIRHHYFWIGFIVGDLLAILIFVIKRRRNKI